MNAVQELGGSYDRIVCSGGDGTLSEVVTGMIHGGLKQPLGYLPAGSTNDFSKTLRLPANLQKAAAIARQATPSPATWVSSRQPHLCLRGRFWPVHQCGL